LIFASARWRGKPASARLDTDQQTLGAAGPVRPD
jgi:hypothetical protein